jgi:GTP cyclohydrolase I
MTVDRGAAERAIAAFLTALGHDPKNDPELAQTPVRVVDAFEKDLLAGYGVDVSAMLREESSVVSGAAPHGPVGVRGMSLTTMCPHHLLPGFGVATLAYLPGKAIVGIGTLARVLEAYAARLTLQESIGENAVRALMDHAGARGAYCKLEFRHACLEARGAKKVGATVVTVARAGARLEDDGAFGGHS